ncbi:MAG: peptide-methionine (S)-S-oxide reductase [Chitinophagaceae bacterium]|nr:MAG: peptide-methionine (S)-S-oxide reductase [Chitinophagaceae bacterium]
MKMLSVFLLLAITACAQPKQEKMPVAKDTKAIENMGQAYFAEGCFWHTELVFQSLEGVKDAVSGYSGGNKASPTYEQVCSGSTGHAETVRIIYDRSKISFEELATVFFESHDPTTLNRQGNDEGASYRSIAFYRTPEEQRILEKLKLRFQKQFKNAIVTEIKPFTAFYAAEEYHQDFIKKNPNNRYINNVSIPQFEEFKKSYKGKLKE